jgi:hypothetical protein
MRWKDRGWKKEIKGDFDVIESPQKDKRDGGSKAANLSLEISEEEIEDIENEGGKEENNSLQR